MTHNTFLTFRLNKAFLEFSFHKKQSEIKIKSVQNIKDSDPRAEIEISGTQYTDGQHI